MITELKNLEIGIDSLYIELKITSFCNMKCDYCFSRDSIESKIDYDNLFKFLKLFYYNRRKYIFYIYGGEPFHSKYLNDIINSIYNFSDNVEIIIQTNGTIDIEKNIKMYHNIKFCLSYHMDHITLNQSKIFLKNILFLKKLNILDDLSILSNHDININNLIFKKLKILNINYHIKQLYQKEYSWSEDMEQHKIVKVKDKDKYILHSCSKLQNLNITNFYNWECSAGFNCILVNHNGKIYNCEFDLMNNRKSIFDLNDFDNNFKPQYNICQNNFCIQYHSNKRIIYDKK